VDPLFCRDIGHGHPIVVVHGGPDFDHCYYLPELDRLADSFRLVYYDQRGRGRSGHGVRPEDVTLGSEIEDLDLVRSRFGLASVAVLGHSWGGVLAMEYAIRHPDRVSQLLLLDTAPASAGDWRQLRESFARHRPAEDRADMEAIAARAGCIGRRPTRRSGIFSPRSDSSTSRRCCCTASTTSSRSSWLLGSQTRFRERASRSCPGAATSPTSRRRSWSSRRSSALAAADDRRRGKPASVRG
jgi:pimeloyl-ACP methyl ester carboxylesterase